MSLLSIQAPSAVVMIRPHRFHPNPETATDNAFQRTGESGDEREAQSLAAAAHDEVTAAAAALEAAGVRVHVFEDDGTRNTPDSVFPNNWFSTHPGGHVALYPMYCVNRRRERRADVIDMLKVQYRVQDVIDYSGLEYDGVFLEGTGAMVLDHIARIAYTARSYRADPLALERFCTHFNFEPVCFETADAAGRAVYHTNVMMSVATEFALIGLDLIVNERRRAEVRGRLLESGRTVIDLDSSQIDNFAANALELSGRDGRVLALSERAASCLSTRQKDLIERSAQLLPLRVPTIEMAGGSVRCMLAGIHLSPRQA
ncbi:citrulline utilization hydrolase CtlX [Paraburkholderia antibiotica]|uniref:Amidinotransferase n=1 Tax=Paraburkholderia antibiotica TaxID=2728839 RepID=A0A7Y0FFS6_9BURK|nr:arginine deiminase-related protein [Paraburkholderia antibiotica]NML34443.1 amidinotransferase [Paraburkholderia antibiotica]